MFLRKLLRSVVRSRPVQGMLALADRIYLPGFEGFSLYEISKFFFRELGDTKLNERVAASTYNFLMAMPPTLLFLFSLVPYMPLTDVQETIRRTLHLVITNPTVYSSVDEVVENFMNTERRDLLSFSVLLTLFFSSNGMMGLMRSFDRGLSVYKKRSGLRRRWTAIKLTTMLIAVMLASITVFVVQTEVLNRYIESIFGSVMAVKAFSILLLLLITFFATSLIYAYGPSLTHRFRFFSAGSVFATLMISITTTVFFFLVTNFLHYNQVYGSIGTLIAFMVWIWLNTLVLLLGYELNVSILLGKISHNLDEENRKQKAARRKTGSR